MPGPYVQLATFCERLLQEADGVMSLIRVIDRINVVAAGPAPPAELPIGQVNATLVIALRSDDAQGRHPIRIGGEMPDGRRLPEQTLDVNFEPGDRGVNLILPIVMEALEGLYWFEVHIHDRLLSRIPLRVMYLRAQSGG